MTLASKLPIDHPFSGGYPRLGGQPLPTDPDAIDYLNRVKAADGGAGVEVGVAMAIDAFVKGCKADSAGYAGDPTRTVWDAMKASCIMCGARTISGALVPLKGGPELWAWPELASVFNAGGSCGSYTSSTRTLSSQCVGTSTVAPRFYFDVGATVGRKYVVTGRLSGDIADVGSIRLGSSSAVSYSPATGVFSGTVTASESSIIFYLDGTKAPTEVTIEEVSIREDFTPTPYNFAGGDYSRTTGLKGDGATKYLDTNRANNADGQDDNHNAVYVSTANTQTTGSYISAAGGIAGTNNLISEVGNSRLFSRNRSAAATFFNSAQSAVGFLGTSRSVSTEYIARISGSSTVSSTSSDGAAADPVYVFARSFSGSAINITDARLAFYSIGSALDLAALDTRVTTLVSQIAAAI